MLTTTRLAIRPIIAIGFLFTLILQIPAQNTVRIWNRAKHSAFTDLVRFENSFICAFRESNAHVPRDHDGDGKIRILRSPDGEKWSDFHLIEKQNIDLRDPKVSVTPDGRLMVLAGGSNYDRGKLLNRQAVVVFYDPQQKSWSKPVDIKIDKSIATEMDWLWRVTWHNKTGYGVVYQPIKDKWGHHLVKTTDGVNYSLVNTSKLPGRPNESTIRFAKNNRMIMVVRNEDRKSRGHIGYSDPPYQQWKWAQVDQRLGGPELFIAPSGRMILGSREYGKSSTTGLFDITLDGSMRQFLKLPSGRDTSYPGIVLHNGRFWMSYYSGHDGRTSIYLYNNTMEEIEKMCKSVRNTAVSKFKSAEYKSKSSEVLRYRLLKPNKIEDGKKYPLVLFLHGAGERGDDNRAQLIHGMNDISSEEIMDQFPAFVIAPQCPKGDAWADYRNPESSSRPRQPLRLALELLDSLIQSNPIDSDRIYITGLSMGGFGTWDAIRHRPTLFAAGVPICGGGDSSKTSIETIKHVPMWVAHGEDDRAVPVKRSQEMVAALKAAGANPIFDLQKGVGHNSWASTYRNIKMYQWMFEQKRKRQ